MTELIYPTIDLFIYDLKSGLGDSQVEIDQCKQNFKNKLPENVRSLLLNDEQVFEDGYIHLLKNRSAQIELQNKSCEGYLYPVLLGDSYGLLIDCAFANKTEAQPTQRFADIKAEIKQILQGQTATLGQTWMLSGWIPPSQTKSPQEIALACYQWLMPGLDWEGDLERQGKFLGATIFEITPNQHHFVIIIYPDEATLNQSGKFYSDWMQLFHYRHKILWAYRQSRLLKKSLQNYFREIKAGSDSIEQGRSKETELGKLYKMLVNVQNILNKYTTELNLLNFQGITIDINLSNYEKRLDRIKQKASKIKTNETELQFLTEFGKLVNNKYRLQITKDSEILERGLKFLSDTINVVRSRVEVEKADRDRNFQNFVTLLATGWAFGGFIAALPGLTEKNNNPVRRLLINLCQCFKFCHIKLDTQLQINQAEPWWLIPATKLIYIISGFLIAMLPLLIWRHYWRRCRPRE